MHKAKKTNDARYRIYIALSFEHILVIYMSQIQRKLSQSVVCSFASEVYILKYSNLFLFSSIEICHSCTDLINISFSLIFP